jgi:predicted RNase H-like HicB family nuclease
VVAAGDAVDETERLMDEAIALYLDELRRMGAPTEPATVAHC